MQKLDFELVLIFLGSSVVPVAVVAVISVNSNGFEAAVKAVNDDPSRITVLQHHLGFDVALVVVETDRNQAFAGEAASEGCGLGAGLGDCVLRVVDVDRFCEGVDFEDILQKHGVGPDDFARFVAEELFGLREVLEAFVLVPFAVHLQLPSLDVAEPLRFLLVDLAFVWAAVFTAWLAGGGGRHRAELRGAETLRGDEGRDAGAKNWK